ncbi:isochorismate synthase, partial [Alicyclobacillus cellulosilyticus]|uniref:isochorismate synthase n=1 Tax=Alicyclobacillus cellulosilyticus TaxID=1003997 RepID=UPI001666D64D
VRWWRAAHARASDGGRPAPVRRADVDVPFAAAAVDRLWRMAAGETASASPDAAARAAWADMVSAATEAIRQGRYEKLVLARAAARPCPEANVWPAMAYLLSAQPGHDVFACSLGRQGVFLGAAPERLVDAAGSRVVVDCLAGTAPRGPDEETDARWASELLASPKQREEHAILVRWVQERLRPWSVRLSAPASPALRRLLHVQHLYTPLAVELSRRRHVLELVDRLHPTPAVAGVPQEAALQFIAAREAWPRGWYAGPVGWFGRQGDGRFAVALRSALWRGGWAYVYAGAGIVATSNPDLEYEETEWKMAPVLAALTWADRGGDGA